MVWNQAGSDREGTSVWAIFSGSISWAVIPASIVGQVRSWVWMAELLGEESSLVEWLGLFISIPGALSSAGSLVLHTTCTVVAGVLAYVFYLAEASIWLHKSLSS